MRYSHKARSIIIEYIKKSMKPIDCGEVLGGHQITTEGRIKCWFLDIIKGNAPLIFDHKSEGYTFVNLHYRYGWSCARISEEYNVPKTTLYRKMDKFFNNLVENMELDMGHEILRIDKWHEIYEDGVGKTEPRWEKSSPS